MKYITLNNKKFRTFSHREDGYPQGIIVWEILGERIVKKEIPFYWGAYKPTDEEIRTEELAELKNDDYLTWFATRKEARNIKNKNAPKKKGISYIINATKSLDSFGFEKFLSDKLVNTTVNRVEFISDKGREFVRYSKEGKKFQLSFQDGGKTLKIFERSK